MERRDAAVMLSHTLTDADISAVETLGGLVTRRFDTLAGYVITIDDSQVPSVRVLPGVTLAGCDARRVSIDRCRFMKNTRPSRARSAQGQAKPEQAAYMRVATGRA